MGLIFGGIEQLASTAESAVDTGLNSFVQSSLMPETALGPRMPEALPAELGFPGDIYGGQHPGAAMAQQLQRTLCLLIELVLSATRDPGRIQQMLQSVLGGGQPCVGSPYDGDTGAGQDGGDYSPEPSSGGYSPASGYSPGGAPSGSYGSADSSYSGNGYSSENPGGANRTVPNQPDVGTSNPGAVLGNSMLTSNQQQFVSELARKTGMDVNVLAAQIYNEENGSAAQSRDADNNNNWLNIGYTDSGQQGTGNSVWSSGPVAAADATAAWMNGTWKDPGFGTASQGIQQILCSAGQSPEAQIQNIQHSGWASSGYPDLPNIYQQIVAKNGASELV